MNQRYEGFLLIELLVALVGMGILALAIARYQSGALLIQQNTHQYMQAIALAGSKLDAVLAHKKLPIATAEQHKNFTINYQIEALSLRSLDIPAPLDAQQTHFYAIKVLAEWKDSTGTKHQVSFATAMEMV